MRVTKELSDKMDARTQIAQSILLNMLAHEQGKPTFTSDKLNDLARRAVLLADAMLNQLAEVEGDKITSEDSRKYWQGRNSELKKSLAALEAEAKQAREDEAWALRHVVYISHGANVWRCVRVNEETREEIEAEAPAIHAAIRALRAKVEGGAR